MSKPRTRPAVGSVCHYCGDPAETWDHIVPKAHGGFNSAFNRVPACLDCNAAKADLMPACPCPVCVNAVHLWMYPGRAVDPRRRGYSVGERAEVRPGRAVETLEQLRDWLARSS